MTESIYEELAIDIVTNCSVNMFTARKVVEYLQSEGLIDYDNLKEHYFDEDSE